ncbi:hypothetical protein [Marinifilum sp.]|uniref:hypothetical protein n=1 Tax=Marinifilum sp. TaxID=2033137 RepID=UPI003BAB9005
MLEHQKMVLNAVSDDLNLFKRELTKSIKWLSSSEQRELCKWVEVELFQSHKRIVQEVFNSNRTPVINSGN